MFKVKSVVPVPKLGGAVLDVGAYDVFLSSAAINDRLLWR